MALGSPTRNGFPRQYSSLTPLPLDPTYPSPSIPWEATRSYRCTSSNDRNPFTQEPTNLHRNTQDSRWIGVPSSPSSTLPPSMSTHPSPGKLTQVTHPHIAYANSQTAPLAQAESSRQASQQGRQMTSRSDSGYTNYRRSDAFIYDVSEIPDTNIRILPSSSVRSLPSRPASIRDGTKPKPQQRANFVVSETHVSPLSPKFPNKGNSPVSAIVDLGWSHVQDERDVGKTIEEKKDNALMIAFPAFDPTYQPLEPVLEHQESHLKKLENLHPPPAVVRRHEESKQTISLSSLYDRAREIYRAGPKGEGQEVWGGLRRRRREGRAMKQANRQRQQFQNNDFEEATRKDARCEELALKGKPYPQLPSEFERKYPLSPLSELASVKTVQEYRNKANGKENMKCSPVTLYFPSPRQRDLPLGASASVQYDAQNVELSGYVYRPQMIDLQPAPRSKMTPPPVPEKIPPPVPEKVPPPVPKKKGDRTTQSQVSMSHAANIKRVPTLRDVQRQKPNSALNPRKPKGSEHLDASPCRQKEQREGTWLQWMGHHVSHLKVPSSTHEPTYTDHHLTKRQDKLKSKISAPQPMMAPGGRNRQIVNFATESGGVGGPMAAKSVPMCNGLAISAQVDEKEKEEKKKKKKNKVPLRPAPLVEATSHAEPNRAKISSTPWLHWATDAVESAGEEREYVYDYKRPKPSRHDSDASFVCRGIDGRRASNARRGTLLPSQHQGRATTRERRLRQRATRGRPGLVPAPLFSKMEGDATREDGCGDGRGDGDGVRDTKFYQPTYDVLGEYWTDEGKSI